MKAHILLFLVRHLAVLIYKPEGSIYFLCSTMWFFVDVIQNLSVHMAAEMPIRQLVWAVNFWLCASLNSSCSDLIWSRLLKLVFNTKLQKGQIMTTSKGMGQAVLLGVTRDPRYTGWMFTMFYWWFLKLSDTLQSQNFLALLAVFQKCADWLSHLCFRRRTKVQNLHQFSSMATKKSNKFKIDFWLSTAAVSLPTTSTYYDSKCQTFQRSCKVIKLILCERTQTFLRLVWELSSFSLCTAYTFL